jgi:hypothetical protein
VTLTEKTKEGILIVATGLTVAYVRHGIETQWASWESVEQFVIYWFVHTVGVLLFMLPSILMIETCYEFFLGRRHESSDYSELFYIILMTVLVGAICIFVVAHWMPSNYDVD